MRNETAARCELGVVGLGVMGRNLALNVADHGFPVVGYDRKPVEVEALRKAGGENVAASGSLAELIASLRPPRAVLMLVPAGPPVDAVIGEVLPFLQPGDVLIDGGNSHYKDTDRRLKDLSGRGFHFLGAGISGWEKGARTGPSLMPGGPPDAYDRVRPVFEAIAARVDWEPCVAYLGPRSAGHYVKMVHNGIEYALMQLIAETYDLMKRGLGLNNDDLHGVYDEWSRSETGSYLLEITSRIFLKRDDRTGGRLIDSVLDHARQKGTGKWTSQEAMDLQAAVDAGIPTPAMAAALAYFDSFRSRRLPANLIQAQRDGFGSHTYERTDAEGVFHTDWLE